MSVNVIIAQGNELMKFWKLVSVSTALILSPSVNAAFVRWNLDNVILTDGQSLVGAFDHDFTTNTFKNFSVTNSGNDIFGVTTYDTIVEWRSAGFQITAMSSEDTTNSSVLLIKMDQFLLGDLKTITLNDSEYVFWNCQDYPNCSSLSTRTFVSIASGALTAVPVPAAVWLFGSGLLTIFGLLRRL